MTIVVLPVYRGRIVLILVQSWKNKLRTNDLLCAGTH
jgi:hypothetical protein